MFQRPDLVGSFAVTADEWRRGDAKALFRVLVATTLFQRRQDQQVMRILRGMTATRAREVASSRRLLKLVDESPCEMTQTQRALVENCDLDKSVNGEGVCSRNPTVPCHLKQHTVWLKRYGHFGKVPTSVALMLREHEVNDLDQLYRTAVQRHDSPRTRSEALDQRLRTVWRVNEKIAAMFLSMACNPDLSSDDPPWHEIDHTYFVVIDSNTDLFLDSVGYGGTGTYAARREFIWELAKRIDLSTLKASVSAYNPRLVQQAAYLFMSQVNRRTAAVDCWRGGIKACAACPKILRARCAVRNSDGLDPASMAAVSPVRRAPPRAHKGNPEAWRAKRAQ